MTSRQVFIPNSRHKLKQKRQKSVRIEAKLRRIDRPTWTDCFYYKAVPSQLEPWGFLFLDRCMIPSAREDYAMPNAPLADVRSRFEMLYREGPSGREAGRRLMISAASASRLGRRIRQGSGLEPPVNPRKTARESLRPIRISSSNWSNRIPT